MIDIATCVSCERFAPEAMQCARCEDYFHECCGQFIEIKEGFVCIGCVEDIQSGGDEEWEKKLEGYIND